MKKMLLPLLTLFFVITACGSNQTFPQASFDDTWSDLFPNQAIHTFTYEEIPLTEADLNIGLEGIFILQENNHSIGYAFQARVNGISGPKSVVFRLTIYRSFYQGFSVLSHREHSGFGVLQFNALTNFLPGTSVDFSLVENILISAQAGRTGSSQTYDGIMPAIERMTDLYLEL
jgi:hypothetical protein